MDHYELLGVARDASQADISVAYRHIARRLHPDVNRAPDAQDRMAELNAAYSVLRDPAKRFEYDQRLAFQEEGLSGPSGAPSAVGVEAVGCQRCGIVDGTLSVVGFDYVFSIFVATWRGRRGGIYCNKCRTILSLWYTLEVLFFGWWGFWGLLWSIPALFSNMAGGVRPREANAELARYLAYVLAARGDLAAAAASARKSWKLSQTPEAEELMVALEEIAGGEVPLRARRSLWGHSYLVTVPVVAAIVAAAAWLVGIATSDNAGSPAGVAGPGRGSSSVRGPAASGMSREQLETEIRRLESKVRACEHELGVLQTELERREDAARRGEQMDELGYQELVEEYNRRVRSCNAKVDRLRALKRQYGEGALY